MGFFFLFSFVFFVLFFFSVQRQRFKLLIGGETMERIGNDNIRRAHVQRTHTAREVNLRRFGKHRGWTCAKEVNRKTKE